MWPASDNHVYGPVLLLPHVVKGISVSVCVCLCLSVCLCIQAFLQHAHPHSDLVCKWTGLKWLFCCRIVCSLYGGTEWVSATLYLSISVAISNKIQTKASSLDPVPVEAEGVQGKGRW